MYTRISFYELVKSSFYREHTNIFITVFNESFNELLLAQSEL